MRRISSLTAIGIVGNARVLATVCAREGNEVRRRGRAGAGDLQLMAPRVELRAGVLVRRVQGDDLMTDEVEAGLDALGDGVLHARVSIYLQGGLPVVLVGGPLILWARGGKLTTAQVSEVPSRPSSWTLNQTALHLG